jgi:NhaA family Na+:H+ antiporter
MKYKLTEIYKDFTSSEKNAGLVLIFCTIISLFVANTSIGENYIHFWHKQIGFTFLNFDLHYSIEHWINDGLMTIFFLLVGLEIERELYAGELHPIKNALLPIFGAIGGMLFPALIFIVINFGTSTVSGFGIPMGTDIAFALAVISLLGNRVPVSIKILLTAIAIIDDLGSILIIALFYGADIHYGFLLASLGIFVFLLVLNILKVHSLIPYLVLGVPMWFFMVQSGIHPTISGVLLAFACPFGKGEEHSPSIKLQHYLHLPVAFIILPLFTLANTAIPFKTEFVSGLSGLHSLGIGLGLLIGKPLGILISFFVITKLKIVKLPEGIIWFDILALGFIAGIGFTMSIFITQLAFTDELLIQSSKMMILIASCCAGLFGYHFFFFKRKDA